MIYNFEEFNDNKLIREGVFNVLKARRQIMKLQGEVIDEYEKLIDENPKKFNDGKSVLKAVEDFARQKYKEIVNADGAMSFSQWWKDFERANSYMLDRTIFLK